MANAEPRIIESGIISDHRGHETLRQAALRALGASEEVG